MVLLEPKDELEQVFCDRLKEIFRLFREKQADYGPGNIAMAGERGVVTRLNDKVQRLRWLLDSKDGPQNESLRDSWLDIADYGVIGLLVHDGEWPPAPPGTGPCPCCGKAVE